MGKKKLSHFKSFLALMANEGGFLRLPVRLLNDDPNGGDGGTGGASGDPDPKPDDKGGYPKEFVEKLLREKNNWKAKAQELEKKITDPTPPTKKEDAAQDDEIKQMLKAEREKREALEKKLEEENEFKRRAMKLGAIKKEFINNGGDDKTFELITKLVEVDKVMIDEESSIVYGADNEIKRIKEIAPQFFTKPKKGTDQGDYKHHVDPSNPEKILEGKRNKVDKTTGSHPLVDFYSAHGIQLRK